MVPCGKCYLCFMRRVSQWSFRLLQEFKHSGNARFITLTYDTEHIPYTEDGKKSVDKRDVQLFIKRLRQCERRSPMYSKDSLPIKYYAVGEYGGKTKRPHYHLIVYNASVQSIEDAWQLGKIHYGTVTPHSVGYTLKYMSKTSRIGTHHQDTRHPQFALMSQGLGLSYLTPTMIKWHKADLVNRNFVTNTQGYKVSMPRYIKLKLYDRIEQEKIANEALMASIDKLYLQAVSEFGNVRAYRDQKANITASYKRMHSKTLQTCKL